MPGCCWGFSFSLWGVTHCLGDFLGGLLPPCGAVWRCCTSWKKSAGGGDGEDYLRFVTVLMGARNYPGDGDLWEGCSYVGKEASRLFAWWIVTTTRLPWPCVRGIYSALMATSREYWSGVSELTIVSIRSWWNFGFRDLWVRSTVVVMPLGCWVRMMWFRGYGESAEAV